MLRSILVHTFLRPRLLATAVAALALAVPAQSAKAVFTLTLSQVGTSVVSNGSGTLNTAALTIGSSTTQPPPFNLDPNAATAFFISSSGTTTYYGFSGPASFGPGGTSAAASVVGSSVGVTGPNATLYLPFQYVSGTAFTNTTTFANATFTSLGFTPGTYTYTWGTGATADSLVITGAVPEPSTWALLGLGAACLGLTLRQRRAARRA